MTFFFLAGNEKLFLAYPQIRSWLDACHKPVLSAFNDVAVICGDQAEASLRVLDSESDTGVVTLAKEYLAKSRDDVALVVDGRYPFLTPYELIEMRERAASGRAAILCPASGGIAAVAVGKDIADVDSVALPEFRSVKVDSLPQWLIAQEIEREWPLFYFNSSYTDYWRGRTAEQKSVDKAPSVDDFVSFFNKAMGCLETGNTRLLDAGCGHGRLFPVFERYGFDIYGVDLSWDAVAYGERNLSYPVTHGSLQNSGMPDAFFGMVCAWAVFEAAPQSKALHHLMGRLEEGGVLLLSGKNDVYEADDSLAIDAERGAASKRFPNGFTDFSAFAALVPAYGGIIADCWYERYRGDMAAGRVVRERPERFYQWVAVIKKVEPTPVFAKDVIISAPGSKTFSRLQDSRVRIV